MDELCPQSAHGDNSQAVPPAPGTAQICDSCWDNAWGSVRLEKQTLLQGFSPGSEVQQVGEAKQQVRVGGEADKEIRGWELLWAQWSNNHPHRCLALTAWQDPFLHRGAVWLLPCLFPSQIPGLQCLHDTPNIHRALWSRILMCLLTPVMIFQNTWATNCYHALRVFTVIHVLKQTQPFLMILYLLTDSLACVYLNSCWGFFKIFNTFETLI